jgi:hypothetical protein
MNRQVGIKQADSEMEEEKMTNDIKFEVGSTHENMKGVFGVVSIHRDKMMIRWDDGSEAVTSVDLQKRIIERMAYENGLAKGTEGAKPKKAKKPSKTKKA